MVTSKAKAPIKEYRVGSLRCAVFENEKGKSYSFSKSYKKEGNWVNQRISLFPEELSSLVLIATQVADENAAAAVSK